MSGQVEDVHHAFPYHLTLECLANGHGLGERRGAAVHALNGFAELVDFYFSHVCLSITAKLLTRNCNARNTMIRRREGFRSSCCTFSTSVRADDTVAIRWGSSRGDYRESLKLGHYPPAKHCL